MKKLVKRCRNCLHRWSQIDQLTSYSLTFFLHPSQSWNFDSLNLCLWNLFLKYVYERFDDRYFCSSLFPLIDFPILTVRKYSKNVFVIMFNKMKNVLNVFFRLSFIDGEIRKNNRFRFKLTTKIWILIFNARPYKFTFETILFQNVD